MDRKAVSGVLLALLLIGMLSLVFNIQIAGADRSEDEKIMPRRHPEAVIVADPENLFMRQFAEFRRNLHWFFNGTYGYSQYQNFTGDTGSQGFAVGQRWMLSQLALLDTYAYEKTNEEKYLVEAKFLVDLFGDSSRQHASGAILSYSKGWSYIDANQYWAMQKLNEYGWGSYNVTAHVDNVITYAGINNATDLMWSYNWDHPEDETWTVNTWRPFLALLAYLTSKNVADYTDEIGRIFNSIERGRTDNNFYAYTLGGLASPHYTLNTLWGILTAYMYVPSAPWNTTAIQATLDAVNSTRFWYEEIGELAGIDVLLQNIDGFNQNLQTKRGLIMYYYANISTFFLHENAYGTEYDRARFVYLTSAALHSLGMASAYTLPTLTNSLLTTTNFAYSPYTLHYPQQAYYPRVTYRSSSGARFSPQNNWAVRWSQRYSTSITDTWNGTHFNTIDAPNTGGGNIMWNITRFAHEAGMTLTQTHILEVETLTGTTYDAFIYMLNGTVKEITDEPTGTVCGGLADFLVVRDRLDARSEISGIFVHSPNNSTWYIEHSGSYTSIKTTTDYVFAKSFYAEWDNSTKTESILLNALGNWTVNGYNLDNWTVDDVLGLSLAEWQRWFYETDTDDLVIYSHNLTASILNVDWASNILSFNLTGNIGETSTTHVYVRDKGEPTTVTGASSWSYDNTTKILTIRTIHDSPIKITIEWTKPQNPREALKELIQTIKSWSLDAGIENSLTTKLRTAYRLLVAEKRNAPLRKMKAFMHKVEVLGPKKLTNEQANYLTTEAQRIINLIYG